MWILTVTATWTTEYYLTVQNGGYGTAWDSGYYAAGSSAPFSISPTTVAGATGVQYVFAAWSGASTSASASASVSMSGPLTVTATWNTEYYLAVQMAVMELLPVRLL